MMCIYKYIYSVENTYIVCEKGQMQAAAQEYGSWRASSTWQTQEFGSRHLTRFQQGGYYITTDGQAAVAVELAAGQVGQLRPDEPGSGEIWQMS